MKKKIIIIIIEITLFVIGLILLNMFSNKDAGIFSDEKHESSFWYSDITPNDYMRVNNFNNNQCNKSYYSPIFSIENNILYDYKNEMIYENVFSLYSIVYGECELQLLFFTTTDGSLFYINNIKEVNATMYQTIEMTDSMYIKDITSDSFGNIYSINVEEQLIDISKNIDEYIKNTL